jgi:hypothetical protein
VVTTFKRKEAFGVRLRGLESGYADKYRARERSGEVSAMAIRLNQDALEHAQNLIKGRQYERDSDWSEAQPSSEVENRFIDENGWEDFAKWHLAYDTEASEETKSRYKFPFGDFRRLHRSALIAAKQRAGSEDYDEVQRGADRLLDELPGEND